MTLEPEPLPEEEPEEPLPGQATLFGSDDEFRLAFQHWQGMPEFVQEDLTPYRSCLVHFASADDVRAFETLVGQRISTRSIWYPKADIGRFADKRYRDDRADP